MGCQNSRDLGAAPSPELVPVRTDARTDASAAAEKRPEAPAAPADAEAPPAAAPAPDEAPAADEAAASDEDASVDPDAAPEDASVDPDAAPRDEAPQDAEPLDGADDGEARGGDDASDAGDDAEADAGDDAEADFGDDAGDGADGAADAGVEEEKLALEDVDFAVGDNSSDDDCVYFTADHDPPPRSPEPTLDVDVSHGVAPPTAAERRAAADVASAYGDYFCHIRFARGWETAPFRREDAAPLFDTAALACALIRSRELGGERAFILRQTDGSARDWFHGDAPDPVAAPRQFVDGLVHATFQDGAGYVEGLDERRVDELLDEYVDWSSAAFAR